MKKGAECYQRYTELAWQNNKQCETAAPVTFSPQLFCVIPNHYAAYLVLQTETWLSLYAIVRRH